MGNKTVRERIKPVIQEWKRDYVFKTAVSGLVSFGATILFAAYNGILGLWLRSAWHGSICVFYLLLVLIRGMLLLAERKRRAQGDTGRRMFLVSMVLLFLLNLALIGPITLMVTFEKPVNIGLIPAIAMAAYTTYKVTMAAVHVCGRRNRAHGDILTTGLRTVSLIDALVSILTLQNTLIMVNSGKSSADSMRTLSAFTSGGIYLLILFITVRLLLTGNRETAVFGR